MWKRCLQACTVDTLALVQWRLLSGNSRSLSLSLTRCCQRLGRRWIGKSAHWGFWVSTYQGFRRGRSRWRRGCSELRKSWAMPAGSGPSFPPPRSLFTVRLLVVDVVVSQTLGRCGQLHEGCRGELQAGEHMCTNTHTHTVRWPHFDCWKLTLGLTVVETMQCALQFRDSLVQSQHSLKAKPRPLLLPHENLELSGAESIMGAPEATACQVAERGRKCLSFLMFSLLSSSFLLSFLPSTPFSPL